MNDFIRIWEYCLNREIRLVVVSFVWGLGILGHSIPDSQNAFLLEEKLDSIFWLFSFFRNCYKVHLDIVTIFYL